MTLGKQDFLTIYACDEWMDGEVRLYPSRLEEGDDGEPVDTTTTSDVTTTSTTPLYPPRPPTPTPEPGGGPNVGAIAGGVIGGVGALIIVVCCALYLRRRRREGNAGRAPKPSPVFSDTSYPHPPQANPWEKSDDQLPRFATEMPPSSTVGSNTTAELPGGEAIGRWVQR